MTDLQTLADDINEILRASGVPLTARAGKRAIKWFRHYVVETGSYSIGKTEARNALRFYDLARLAA